MTSTNFGLVSLAMVLSCGSLGLLSSCGKDSGGDKANKDAPKGAFLKESDFTSAQLRDVSQTDLQGNDESSVNEMSDLQRSIDSDSDSSKDGEDKTAECIFGSATYSVSNKSTVTFAAETDAAACLQKEAASAAGGATAKFTKYKTKFYAQIICEGADLSIVNGKKITETDSLDKILEEKCNSVSQRSIVSNLEMESEIVYTIDGKEQKQASIRAIAQMQADGTPCSISKSDNLWSWADGCGFYNKTVTTASDTSPAEVGKALIKIIKFIGVKEAADTTSPYYSAGKATIDINGWTGEALFAGPTQAPSWSLKKGDATVTGVFTPITSNL